MATTPQSLPDHLSPRLQLVFVGINPGWYSAQVGHYYANPGNHFWRLMQDACFLPEEFSHEDDQRILEYRIGLTDLVKRPTRSASDLSKLEMADGAGHLLRKLRRYGPRIVCFNGKAAYEPFLDRHFTFGPQDRRIEGLPDTSIFVTPSTAARVAQYQYPDKLRFFRELKRIVDREAGR